MVLKGLAEHLDISVAELIEGLSLQKIEQLKPVYNLDLNASDSHNLQEAGGEQ